MKDEKSSRLSLVPGTEEPPNEAYSRVTNSERFQSLHGAAFQLLSRLEATYDVNRVEGYGLDHELERGDLVHPTVKLVPQDLDAAPMIVVFTAFPGLRIRVGHWYTDAFPACGCDACDETADEEAIRLNELVDNVTARGFRETIRLPLVGDAWQESEFWSLHGRSSSSRLINRSRVHQILSKSEHLSFDWKPWPQSKKVIGSDAI